MHRTRGSRCCHPSAVPFTASSPLRSRRSLESFAAEELSRAIGSSSAIPATHTNVTLRKSSDCLHREDGLDCQNQKPVLCAQTAFAHNTPASEGTQRVLTAQLCWVGTMATTALQSASALTHSYGCTSRKTTSNQSPLLQRSCSVSQRGAHRRLLQQRRVAVSGLFDAFRLANSFLSAPAAT